MSLVHQDAYAKTQQFQQKLQGQEPSSDLMGLEVDSAVNSEEEV